MDGSRSPVQNNKFKDNFVQNISDDRKKIMPPIINNINF